MRKRAFLAVFLLVFALVSLVPPKGFAEEKVISMNFSNFFPAPHKNSLLSAEWCKEVEKRTNGRLKITYFPGGTLTPAAQTFDGVLKGITDVGESAFGYTSGRFPFMAIIDLPLGYKSGYAATKMTNEYYNKFKPKELDEVKVMWLHAHGPGLLFTKKPVAKLEDLQGMKVRGTGFSAKLISALGGAPVAMPQPEAYDGLRTGVIEGILNPIEAMKGWKIGEVIKYCTENYSTAYTTSFFVVMNKSKWDSLPPDIQNTIEEINREWIEKQGKVWDEIDKEGRAFMLERNNQFIQLSKEEDARWVEKAKPVVDEYVSEVKAKGMPGDEALKFIRDYLEKN